MELDGQRLGHDLHLNRCADDLVPGLPSLIDVTIQHPHPDLSVTGPQLLLVGQILGKDGTGIGCHCGRQSQGQRQYEWRKWTRPWLPDDIDIFIEGLNFVRQDWRDPFGLSPQVRAAVEPSYVTLLNISLLPFTAPYSGTL
jgi:hypothetical protein